jgi:hypothetical protein
MTCSILFTVRGGKMKQIRKGGFMAKKQKVWVILVKTYDGRFATVEGAWVTKAKAKKAMKEFATEGDDTFYSEDEMTLMELEIN